MPPVTRIVFTPAGDPDVQPGGDFQRDAHQLCRGRYGLRRGVYAVRRRFEQLCLYVSSVVITSSGTHTVQWFSQDNAGNVEVTKSTTVLVQVNTSTSTADTTPPVTRITFSTISIISTSSQTYVARTTRISFIATDVGSGVALTQYSVDSGTFQNFCLLLYAGRRQTHTVATAAGTKAGNLRSRALELCLGGCDAPGQYTVSVFLSGSWPET